MFHQTDAKKMLAAMSKIVKAGNLVQFGPGPKENSIQNKKTGRKAFLDVVDKVYVMNVKIKDGEKDWKGKIAVDSGAAENVMPKEWVQNEQTLEKVHGM